MAVKIRLTRIGKIREPHYRVVVADSRTRRDGRAIEQIGIYQPTREPSLIEINSERAQYWLGVGAQPTEQVKKLLKLTGDWHKFKGIGEPVNRVKGQPEKAAYVAPEAKSVIKEEAAQKSDAAAETEAPAAEAEAPAEETAEA